MRRLTGLIALQALGLAAIASAGGRTAEEARPRVEGAAPRGADSS